MRANESDDNDRPMLGWLVHEQPHSERSVRMEALIARIRLMVIAVNALALGLLLDTREMDMRAAWWLVGIGAAYGVPTVIFEPYRRWRVFRTSMLTTALDSVTIAAFVAVTGGSDSPFFLLYYLSVAAVAMRFELRQALFACAWYGVSYACAYFFTAGAGTHETGVLVLRLAYMFFIAVGVGHLAREENTRAMQIDEIERLNVENQKLQNRHDRAARFDRLTGILNRAYFEKDAQREIKRARSSGGYLSVLFCDMDHLKRVNDELGHDVGDRVLRAVGAALKRELRSQDLIGRYGGDEFVAVLPNVTRETAFERAEQLVAAVSSVNTGLPEHLSVGLSVGIATFPFDAQDYALLVRLADQAMYLAKREGGDRARTANDLRLFWEDIPHSA